VEDDGPGGEIVPAATDEPQELAAVHTGHPAGHLPAPEGHLQCVRGPYARLGWQRILPGLPGEPDDQVPEVHQAVQGQQRSDVR